MTADVTEAPVPIRAAPGIATVMVALGVVFIVVGGLVAAVARPMSFELGSWLAAYLVLICGVTQYVLGRAQDPVAAVAPGRRTWWLQCVCWNAGNALVVIGTVVAVPVIVDVGSIALLITLVTALAVSRGSAHRWRWAYRAALVVVAVGVPVGSLLAHLRHG